MNTELLLSNRDFDIGNIFSQVCVSVPFENGNWDDLEFFINQSQEGFVQKIRRDYPSLSEDDIHIILLMRVGLTHRQIASFCNILLSSFRRRRSRLKKKMKVRCDSISKFICDLY